MSDVLPAPRAAWFVRHDEGLRQSLHQGPVSVALALRALPRDVLSLQDQAQVREDPFRVDADSLVPSLTVTVFPASHWKPLLPAPPWQE